MGPQCLNWFDPIQWGNSDSITLEISRIVLCLQIFAVAVELPKKYMLKHWLSVVMLLLPVMTAGWLIIGLFVWILIPGLNFSSSLLVSACITATDPILAQSVVSGKFAQRVPGHLRNLLSAESGCNDGMAFPFIYLSLNLIINYDNPRKIVKDWICITILYECIFGCILGICIGYGGRIAIKFAEEKKIIDRESFLAFYVVLAFMCAGFGSILGVDDLLVSFAAGTAFSWNGWFSKKTEESKVSTVIDLLLNLAYFVYFGAIIPWPRFNDHTIGIDIWRLIVLAIVVIFLRRIPAVFLFKPLIPDIKSWREALFVGHFGPIGVGAIFASILARAELEGFDTGLKTPLKELPSKGAKNWQLIACIWPIACFLIVTSIVVHGSSVAVITLGRHLNTITLTKSFTTHTLNDTGINSSWMQRLPGLDKTNRSFSLHRIDTQALEQNQSINSTETTDINTKQANIKKRKYQKNFRKKRREKFKTHPRCNNEYGSEDDVKLEKERIKREKNAQAASFALTTSLNERKDKLTLAGEQNAYSMKSSCSLTSVPSNSNEDKVGDNAISTSITLTEFSNPDENKYKSLPSNKYETHLEDIVGYEDNNCIIIENKEGEIVDYARLNKGPKDEEEGPELSLSITPSHFKNFESSVITKKTIIGKEHGTRYRAYKINDQLIIENQDGEVLRRYKIHTHMKDADNIGDKTKGLNIISKVLFAIGLGKPISNINKGDTLTKNQKILISSCKNSANLHIQSLSQNKVASNTLKKNQINHKDISPDIELYEHKNDNFVDDNLETPVEKTRRLAALGYFSAPRTLDDEEEILTLMKHSNSSDNTDIGTTGKLKNTIERAFHMK